jgi:phage tail sheath protein FI
MADSAYHHGARIKETSGTALSLKTISTAIIGMVVTADDADATAYPINTPVLVTRPADGIAKAGTKGTLAKALQAIDDQVSCRVVVVRVEEGIDAEATTSNIVGTTDASGRYTGMKALLTAEQRLGVRPRIIGVPGHDTKAVTTALVPLAKKLSAMTYASCDGCATISDAVLYRKGFSARELMLIWPDFTGWDTTAKAEGKLLTIAIALGLRAQIDGAIGWHKVLSNVPVDGVTGISADVFFDYLTEGTDADMLNEAGITTLVNRNGFRFWGSRTCDDGDFVFESFARTAQVIKDTVGEGVFEYSDKPMHASLVRDIVESINAKFRDLKTAGKILGARCWFDPSLNDKSQLKVGKLTLSYDYTPVPPLEDLTLIQTFTDTYVADLIAAITATNNA